MALADALQQLEKLWLRDGIKDLSALAPGGQEAQHAHLVEVLGDGRLRLFHGGLDGSGRELAMGLEQLHHPEPNRVSHQAQHLGGILEPLLGDLLHGFTISGYSALSIWSHEHEREALKEQMESLDKERQEVDTRGTRATGQRLLATAGFVAAGFAAASLGFAGLALGAAGGAVVGVVLAVQSWQDRKAIVRSVDRDIRHVNKHIDSCERALELKRQESAGPTES